MGIVGFMDDRRPLSPVVRLVVHFAAAMWAVAWLGGLPNLRFGSSVSGLGSAGYVLGVLGIVWIVNLFNFMDGIDGIAASEAIFVSVAWTLLAVPLAGSGSAAAAIVFAAACSGFLLWNWPPAKIFMGDVGSGYLGYVVAILAIDSGRTNPIAVWVWLILGGVFFTDATITLIRRWARRERVHLPHRSHAYQWLARRWRSHRRVTLTIAAVNVGWLLPWAWLAMMFPTYIGWILVAALTPVAALATTAGAGRAEDGPGR